MIPATRPLPHPYLIIDVGCPYIADMKRNALSHAAKLGKQDGLIQAYLPDPRSSSDCFMRRHELAESDRKEYAEAFDAELRKISAERFG